MIWLCRTLLLFLICAAFFPKSRTQNPVLSPKNGDDKTNENDKSNEDVRNNEDEGNNGDDTKNIDDTKNGDNIKDEEDTKDGDDAKAGDEKPSSEDTKTADEKPKSDETNEETTGRTTTPESSLEASDQHLVTEDDLEDAYLVRDPDNENKICLALNFEGGFTIFYPDKKGKKLNNELSQSGIVDSDGKCDVEPDVHCITLQWPDYNFTLAVNTSGPSDSWQLKTMELTFNPQKVFDAPDEPSLTTLSADKNTIQTFTGPLNKSFSFSPDKPITFYKNDGKAAASAGISQLQIQVFGAHPVQETVEPVAKRKSYQSDTAPIAVGSTLAILTLGVIAGYAIYRSLIVKKVDYGNIQGE